MARPINRENNTYIVFLKRAGDKSPLKSKMNCKENIFSIEYARTLEEAMTNARIKYLDYDFLAYHCRTHRAKIDFSIQYLKSMNTYIENVIWFEKR